MTETGELPESSQTAGAPARAIERGAPLATMDALREDVHTLGDLVGQVVREQAGDRIFGLVEEVRMGAARGCGDRIRYLAKFCRKASELDGWKISEEGRAEEMTMSDENNEIESQVLTALDTCVTKLNEAHRSLRMWHDDPAKLSALQEHTLAVMQHANTAERIVRSTESLSVSLRRSVTSIHHLLDEVE